MRITALDHEPGHDTMEGQSVIEALIAELDKIIDCKRSDIRIELESDRSVIPYRDLSFRIICIGCR